PTVGSQPIDSLFRVTNGGELNLDSIQVTRIRSFIGAEEIPVVSVVPESGKYGEISSIPGILTFIDSIISGSGSFAEKWSGKGINEICSLNYAPLIVGSSTGKVTLIGTTVRESEGTGIYVSGGAQLSVDSTSTLISNGERVGSSLSGMQTHVVCYGIDASGYPITTSVEINTNALPSFIQNQETWVFADSFKECNSIIRSPGILIVGRLAPQATSGSIAIKSDESGSKTVKATVSGNYLNPCDRILILEVRNQYRQTFLYQNLNETSSNAAGAQWESIDKFSLDLPSSSFTDATSESKYGLRVIEYTKGSQSEWVDASLNFEEEQTSPTEEEHEDVSSGLSTGAIIGLSVGIPLLILIILVIVIICIVLYSDKQKNKEIQQPDQQQSQDIQDVDKKKQTRQIQSPEYLSELTEDFIGEMVDQSNQPRKRSIQKVNQIHQKTQDQQTKQSSDTISEEEEEGSQTGNQGQVVYRDMEQQTGDCISSEQQSQDQIQKQVKQIFQRKSQQQVKNNDQEKDIDKKNKQKQKEKKNKSQTNQKNQQKKFSHKKDQDNFSSKKDDTQSDKQINLSIYYFTQQSDDSAQSPKTDKVSQETDDSTSMQSQEAIDEINKKDEKKKIKKKLQKFKENKKSKSNNKDKVKRNVKKSKSAPKKASKVQRQQGSNSDDEQYRESEEENIDNAKRQQQLHTLKSSDSALIGEQSTDITQQQRKGKSSHRSIQDASDESEGSDESERTTSSSSSSQLQSSSEESTHKKERVSTSKQSSVPSVDGDNKQTGKNDLVKFIDRKSGKSEKDSDAKKSRNSQDLNQKKDEKIQEKNVADNIPSESQKKWEQDSGYQGKVRMFANESLSSEEVVVDGQKADSQVGVVVRQGVNSEEKSFGSQSKLLSYSAEQEQDI
ncbi:MAG: hypothetical protein EZS28_003221, partial [Streblomastix strix]